jgi:hypothetical protein
MLSGWPFKSAKPELLFAGINQLSLHCSALRIECSVARHPLYPSAATANAALAGDLDDIPLGTPKKAAARSRRATRKRTMNRPKEMIPTTDIQKTNSRISMSCVAFCG